jgi:hypothetical protein
LCRNIFFFFFGKVRVSDYAWIIEYPNVTIEYYVSVYYFNKKNNKIKEVYCVGTKNLNFKVKLDVCLFFFFFFLGAMYVYLILQ